MVVVDKGEVDMAVVVVDKGEVDMAVVVVDKGEDEVAVVGEAVVGEDEVVEAVVAWWANEW